MQVRVVRWVSSLRVDVVAVAAVAAGPSVAVVAVVVVAGCTQSSPRSALHSILGLQRPVLIFLSLPISLCLLEGWASQPDLKGLQGGGSTLW